MNFVLLGSIVSFIGWTLLHFIWQGLLIGLLHEVLVRATRHHSPQLRYGISVIGLIALLVSPIATFWLLATDGPAAAVLVQSAVSASPVIAAPSEAVIAPLHTLEAWLPYVVALWLFGVATLSLRFGIGLLGLRRLLQHADYDAVAEWMHEELKQLAERMGVKQRVRIALSIRVDSPLVVGWLHPVILLPLSSVTGLDHQQLRMVLAHELAHLRRHDHLVNVLQAIAETVLFFHPAVYRISKSMRQEREQCCDDLAVAVDGNRLAYARLLASLEEMRQCERRHALALGIVDQELYARVERLVDGSTATPGQERWLPVLIIALAGLVFASRTAELDAPLLPAMFESAPARHRIALELPAPSVREFVPIGRSAIEPATESRRQETAEVKESSRPVAPEPRARVATQVEKPRVQAERDAPDVQSEPARTALTRTAKVNEDTKPAIVIETGGELVHATQPAYPRKAMRRGVEGSVRLAFTITKSGTVTDIEVVESKPAGTFDRAAEEAVASWRYQPFMENGVPVARRAAQVLDFRLTEKSRTRRPGSIHDCEDLTGTRLCGVAALPQTQLEIGTGRN